MGGNVYTDKKICEFISEGAISSENKIGDGQIQPSSLDLRCGFGKKIWHMPYASIPDENLIDVLDSNSAQSFELDKKITRKEGIALIALYSFFFFSEIFIQGI